MEHKISRILDQIGDYKNCLTCGYINWYENEDCVHCYNTEFRPTTENDVLGIIEAYEESGHYCEDCEVEI